MHEANHQPMRNITVNKLRINHRLMAHFYKISCVTGKSCRRTTYRGRTRTPWPTPTTRTSTSSSSMAHFIIQDVHIYIFRYSHKLFML